MEETKDKLDRHAKECELRLLISKAEEATADTAHIVLYDALVMAHKESWITDGQYDTAMKWRNHGALTDAALTLVPERKGGNKAGFLHHAFWQGSVGDIPDDKLALTLCIKALKARAQTVSTA